MDVPDLLVIPSIILGVFHGAPLSDPFGHVTGLLLRTMTWTFSRVSGPVTLIGLLRWALSSEFCSDSTEGHP
jgi:ABC-type phosphate transport system permease subunit